MIITLDGPMASGKSSIAAALAERLGFMHLNSGLLYRAVAYLDLQYIALAESTNPQRLVYRYGDHKAHIVFDNQDITRFLKMADIDRHASVLSACPEVRQALLDFQQSFAQSHDMVADGRDCGTVIFPGADYKFFVIADEAVRVARWHADQQRRGNDVSLEEACCALRERDIRDSSRACAPLRPAPDAEILDTSDCSVQEIVEYIVQKIDSKKLGYTPSLLQKNTTYIS